MLTRKQLKTAFDKVDKDSSNSIEISELESLCKDLKYDVNIEEVKKLFTEIDLNQDGKISFEEFTAWWRLGRNNKLKKGLKHVIRAQNYASKKINVAAGSDERDHVVKLDLQYGEQGTETEKLAGFDVLKGKSQISFCADGEGHLGVKDLFPELADKPSIYLTIGTSDVDALAKGFADFKQAGFDFILETQVQPEARDEATAQMESTFGFLSSTALPGKFVIAKDLSDNGAYVLMDPSFQILKKVIDGTGFRMSASCSSKNSVKDLLNTSFNDLTQAWQLAFNVSFSKNWKEAAKQLFLQFTGSEDEWNSFPYDSLNFFVFEGKMRAKTGEDLERSRKLLNDVLGQQLKNTPAEAILANPLTDCEHLNGTWQTHKDQLRPILESCPVKPSQFPFVQDFVDCLNKNATFDAGISFRGYGVVYNLTAKSEGVGELVNDLLSMTG